MPTSDPRSEIVLEMAEEFLERYRRGERPSLKEYVDRHPSLAEEIREVFPAMAMMENVGLADESLAGDPTGEGPRARPGQPEQLGDYRIIREIGRGGMGIVYEAEQVSLGRHVALKVLPPGTVLDPNQKRRFERESKAAGRLHHTNIVPVFGVGEHDGTPYYVMQFIQGLGLDGVLDELRRMRRGLPEGERGGRRDLAAAEVARSLLTGTFENATTAADSSDGAWRPDVPIEGPAATLAGPPTVAGQAPLVRTPAEPHHSRSASASLLSNGSAPEDLGSAKGKARYWRVVARMGAQVADALDYAHKQGIVHRDVKPSNLLLDARGTLWVTDFGLAKADDQQNLTHTGDVLGTLRYMPPEAFEGKANRSGDVYSLGLTLYEMLAFQPAFGERDRGRLVRQVTTEEAPRLGTVNPEVPRDLDTIIHKTIDRDPARRYATAGELAADLQRFVDDEPITARRLSQLEKFGRWSRRHKAIVALLATLGVVLSGGLAGMTLLWARAERNAVAAGENEHRARRNEAFALRQVKLADERAEELRRSDYVSRINLAHREFQDNNVARARKLLEGCPDDLRGWEWDYVHRQCHLDLWTVRDERPAINAVAFSPDGKRIATGSGHFLAHNNVAGHLLVRDAATGREVFADRDSDWGVGAVAFSPDGGLLASGSGPTVVLRDAATGRVLRRIEKPGSADDLGVLALAFRPDGRAIIAGYGRFNADGPPGFAILWSPESGEEIARLSGRGGGVWCASFSPDGHEVAISNDGAVEVWDVRATPKPVRALRGHEGYVYGVAFSPDGRLIGSAGLDRTVKLWDRATGDLVRTLSGHAGFVRGLAFSPDGARVVSVGEDKNVKLWSVGSERELGSFPGHEHYVNCVAFSPDGRTFATGGLDQALKLWSAVSNPQLVIEGFSQPVHNIWFGRGGKEVLVDGVGGPGVVPRASLDPVTGEPLRLLSPGAILAFSPGGERLATRGMAPGRIQILNTEGPRNAVALNSGRSFVAFGAFRKDGARLATADSSGALKVCETETGRELLSIQVTEGKVVGLAFGLDGARLAAILEPATGQPREVRTWDAITGAPQRMIGDFSRHVAGMAFHPTGRQLVVVGGDGQRNGVIWVCDLESGRVVRELVGHTDQVTRAVFSPDGRRLATASGDRTVKIWDAENYDELFTLRGHVSGLLALAFSPDGARIASGGFDRAVRVWDVGPIGPEVYVRREAASRVGAALGTKLDRRGAAILLADDPALPADLREIALVIVARVDDRWDLGLKVIRATEQAISAAERALQAEGHQPSERRQRVEVCRVALDASIALDETIRQGPDGGSSDPYDLYNLASFLSILSVGMSEAEPKEENAAEAMAALAVRFLRHAMNAGFAEFDQLDVDRDLDPLRSRADFRESFGAPTPSSARPRT